MTSPIVVYVPLTMRNVAKYRTWSLCATVSNILLKISQLVTTSDRHRLAAAQQQGDLFFLEIEHSQIPGSAHRA